MQEIKGYLIYKAYFKTIKKHTNRPNEIQLINVDIKKTDNTTVSIVLDNEEIGIVPSSSNSRILRNNNKFNIYLTIDKPSNIDTVPFRYQMKLYQLFGKEFTIKGGDKE